MAMRPDILIDFLRRRVTLTPIAFCSEAVTTCFNTLDLSRLGIEHSSSIRLERSNRLHHCRGYIFLQEKVYILIKISNAPANILHFTVFILSYLSTTY